MARRKVSITQWNGWMSNDQFAWQTGSSYICENLEIRKNSRFISLSWGTESLFNAQWPVTAFLWTQTSDLLAFTSNWHINSNSYNTSNWGGAIYYNEATSWALNYRNVVSFTISWTEYNLILSETKIHRFIYDKNWTYFNILWNIRWIDPNFSTPSEWSWANWTISWWLAIHTSGATTALTPTTPLTAPASWQYYRIQYSIDPTSWSTWTFTIWFWGATSWNITNSPWTIWSVYLSTTTTGWLIITPSSDCDVKLDYIRVQRADWDGSVGIDENYKTFTKSSIYRPALVWNNKLYIGSGNTVEVLDDAWTLSTYFTVDSGYIVRAITNIGDQIVVWTNNWSSGRQYLWNWSSSSSYSRMIQWIDLPIVNVVVIWDMHYVWTAKDDNSQRHLYLSDWYTRNLITKSFQGCASPNSGRATSNPRWLESRFYFYWEKTNAIESDWDIVYLPWYWKIYQYGKWTPGTPNSLDTKTLFTWTELTAMYTTTGNVWVWFAIDNNWTYNIKRIENRTEINGWSTNLYNGNWIIELNPYVWLASQKKANVYVGLWARFPHSSTSVNVYARKDDDINTITFWVSWITTTPTAWAVYTYNSKSFTVVSSSIASGSGYVVATRTNDNTNAFSTSWTLTKSSWTWDSSISFSRWIQYWIITQFSDTTKYKHRYMYNTNFNKIQYAIELISTNTSYTPEVYDFHFTYDDLESDV